MWNSITDIACLPEPHGMHIVLHDINPEALDLVGGLCKEISKRMNAGLTIETTTDLDAVLTGDRDLAVEALALDPMVPSPDIAAQIASDVFAAYKDYLPQFEAKQRK